VSVIKEWRQKEVMAELSGRLLIGLDDALQFAEDQAQAMAPHRTGKLKISVAHDVVVKGNSIAGRLGIRRGRGSRTGVGSRRRARCGTRHSRSCGRRCSVMRPGSSAACVEVRRWN
jgi:hypothetical protein